MIRPELKEFATPINDLKPHPNNVRQGDIGAISQSLKQHGQYRPIVVQRSTGFILAGNHTYKAAISLKWKQIAATYVDCDDEQALRILLIDNRANDLASYDDSALVEMLKGLMDTELKLEGTGFDPDDLDQLLKDLDMESGNAIEGDPDAVPDDAPSKTVPGDVWLLGNHRLMCGDSTSPTNIERLMSGKKADIVWTDPPYGVNIQEKDMAQAEVRKRRKDGLGVMNDHLKGEELRIFLNAALSNAYAETKAGGAWYVASPSGDLMYQFCRVLADLKVWRHSIIWVKDMFTLGRADYHYRHEEIFYGWKEGAGHIWHGDRKQDTVWEVARPKRSPEHPTMKPIELITKALNNSSSTGDIVLDPFGGSGSTLIAAHQTGRTAYLMELDPHYCDVICKRFQQATGITPIAEATGNEHSFIE